MRAITSIVLALATAGCMVAPATGPAPREVVVDESCPPDRYWDGHKCKVDKEAKHEEKEERKEEKREDKDERKAEKQDEKDERKADKERDKEDRDGE